MALASGCSDPACLPEPSWFPPPTPQVFLTLSYISFACLWLLLFATLVQVFVFRRTPARISQHRSFRASCGLCICALVLAVAGQMAYEPYAGLGISPQADYSEWARHLSSAALTHMGAVIGWYSLAGSLTMLATVVLLCILVFQVFAFWISHPRKQA